MKPQPDIFHLSPLIRVTLINLYIALTIPLPFLAEVTAAPIEPIILWVGLILGLILLSGALSEQVILDEHKIAVTYPSWFAKLFSQGWSLSWSEIKDLKLRTTGQGGLVYYFITQTADRAYLLPMRVAGFASLLKIIEERTSIDTRDIRPLSQPWMYLILLGLTLFLLLIDTWTIWTATTQI